MVRSVSVGDGAYGGGEFQNIPEGTRLKLSVYAVEESTVQSEGENKGKSQLIFTFKVQDGQYAGREIRYQRIPLYDGTTAWRLVTFAKAIGLETKPTVQLPDNNNELLGKTFIGQIGIGRPNSQGKQYNEVSRFFSESDESAGGSPAASSTTTQTTKPSWSNLGS